MCPRTQGGSEFTKLSNRTGPLRGKERIAGAVKKRRGLSRLGKVTLGIVNNSGRQPQNHLEACENPAFRVPPAVSNLVDWGRGLRTGISRAFPGHSQMMLMLQVGEHTLKGPGKDTSGQRTFPAGSEGS